MKEQLEWMLDVVEVDGQSIKMNESWERTILNTDNFYLRLYIGEDKPENVIYQVRRTFRDIDEPNEYERNKNKENAIRQIYENVFIKLMTIGLKQLITNHKQQQQ